MYSCIVCALLWWPLVGVHVQVVSIILTMRWVHSTVAVIISHNNLYLTIFKCIYMSSHICAIAYCAMPCGVGVHYLRASLSFTRAQEQRIEPQV